MKDDDVRVIYEMTETVSSDVMSRTETVVEVVINALQLSVQHHARQASMLQDRGPSARNAQQEQESYEAICDLLVGRFRSGELRIESAKEQNQ